MSLCFTHCLVIPYASKHAVEDNVLKTSLTVLSNSVSALTFLFPV